LRYAALGRAARRGAQALREKNGRMTVAGFIVFFPPRADFINSGPRLPAERASMRPPYHLKLAPVRGRQSVGKKARLDYNSSRARAC
jgi:hypothetical protein